MNAIQNPHPDATDYFVRRIKTAPRLNSQDQRTLIYLSRTYSVSINRFLSEHTTAQNMFDQEFRRATEAFQENRRDEGNFHLQRLENLCEDYPFLETTPNIHRFHELVKQSSLIALWIHRWKQAVNERTGYTFEAPVEAPAVAV